MPRGIITSIENGYFTVQVPENEQIVSYHVKDDILPQDMSIGAGVDFETEGGLVTKVNALEDSDLEDLSSQLDDIINDDPSFPT